MFEERHDEDHDIEVTDACCHGDDAAPASGGVVEEWRGRISLGTENLIQSMR